MIAPFAVFNWVMPAGALDVVLMLGLNSVILNAMGYGQFEIRHILICGVFMFFVSLVAALIPIIRAMQISPATATKTV